MKVLGWALFGLGAVMLVASGVLGVGGIANISGVLIGVGLVTSGAIFASVGEVIELIGKRQLKPVSNIVEAETIEDSERDLSSDSYRIYLVNKYAIRQSDVFGQIVCKDRLFDKLEDAVDYAHQTDLSLTEEHRVRVVRRGKIGLNDLAYEEIATGEVTVTGPDGEKAKFESEKSAFKFFDAYLSKGKELAAFKQRAKGETDS